MRALITGAGGQDGIYLTDLLLSMGYEVYCLTRRNGREPASKAILPEQAIEIEGDVLDCELPEVEEVYHLAAQSHVGYSFASPFQTMNTNVMGTMRMLEHARKVRAKFYQASTSELFGATNPPQSERSPMHPRSPYAVSKLAAYWATINYREAYGIPTYNGILFNHESPLRGADFVTQKVAQGVADIVVGDADVLRMGNLESRRDWGYAPDYVNAMWLMMQSDPGEYVVATGQTHSVRELLDVAFYTVGIANWSRYVVQDARFMRPADVDHLCGDASKIRALGWRTTKTFEEMIREMVGAALEQRGMIQPKMAVAH